MRCSGYARLVILCLLTTYGCSIPKWSPHSPHANDEPDFTSQAPPGAAIGTGGSIGVDGVFTSALSLSLAATDERTPTAADAPPPPISGGTLAVSVDGKFAIAADPDRDRISIIDLAKGESGALGAVRELTLSAGSEPGRVVTDKNGRAHVALRRGGAVLTLDIAAASILYQRDVCAAPRGLAVDDADAHLVVACEDGIVAELPLGEGDVLSRIHVTEGLRDVELDGDTLILSLFKSAEILRVDRLGNVLKRKRPEAVPALFVPMPIIDFSDPSTMAVFDDDAGVDDASSPLIVTDDFVPQVAWRMHKRDDGTVLLLHGMYSRRLIGTTDPTLINDMLMEGSSYGGDTESCTGLTQNAVTVVSTTDDATATPGVLNMPGLVVDVAEFAPNGEIAFARPGAADGDLPMSKDRLMNTGLAESEIDNIYTTAQDQLQELSSTLVIGNLNQALNSFCERAAAVEIDGQVTAVAYTPDGTLLAQSREPAALFVVRGWDVQTQVLLGGNSVLDSGHDLFHRNSGGGIACAQCHPQGGEDGHVWNFSDVGPRRTQPLFVKLQDTAPFHWGGDLESMNALMDDVFTMRMGGAHQTSERVDVLARWLFSLSPPAPANSPDDPAAQRGKTLFESLEVGCVDCHSGPKFSDNLSHDVGIAGVTEATQTPSLLGVAYRAPYMHIGCAETLRDRFDPSCGGTDHGNIANLTDQDINDLVAYMNSL